MAGRPLHIQAEKTVMPDLFVHSISGYILARPKWKKRMLPSIFVLGCIFPDLIRGPLLMIGNAIALPYELTFPFLILHSPVPLVIQSWLFSRFFEEKIRFRVFLNLTAGILVHLILDAGQKAYHISYLWLFPFSFKNPVPGLWWADDGLWITGCAMILGGVVSVFRKWRTP